MEAFFSYYTILTLLLGVGWLVIFFAAKELRREQLIVSALALLFLPVAFHVGVTDTAATAIRLSSITVTDAAFAFFLAGIAGVVFHATFGKHYHRLPKAVFRRRRKEEHVTQFWMMRLFIAFLLYVWGVILLVWLMELTVGEALILAAAMSLVYLVSHRRDLLADALWSSGLTAMIVFIAASLASIFSTTSFELSPVYSGHFIGTVPVDLILWSLTLGLAIGPLYEYVRRFELR